MRTLAQRLAVPIISAALVHTAAHAQQWSLVTEFPDPLADASGIFGIAMDLSASTLAVSDARADTFGHNAGVVYIYERSGAGWAPPLPLRQGGARSYSKATPSSWIRMFSNASMRSAGSRLPS